MGLAVVERARPATSSTGVLCEVPQRRFLSEEQWALLEAIAARLLPQADREEPVPIVPWIDDMLASQSRPGLSLRRHAADARGVDCRGWTRSRRKAASVTASASSSSPGSEQDCAACAHVQLGRGRGREWRGPAGQALLQVAAAERGGRQSIIRTPPPGARSASADRRARAAMSASASTSAIPGKRKRSSEPMLEIAGPRAIDGRAPDVFRQGKWVPMRSYDDTEEVDFAIVGTGAGGGTLACKLAEAGFSVVAFDAGPFWRPLEEFASDETRAGRALLDRRADHRRRRSGRARARTTAARRRRKHRPLHDDRAALAARSGSSAARRLGYGRRLADRFDEIEPYYRRGRGGAEDRRAGPLSVGPAAEALPLARRIR